MSTPLKYIVYTRKSPRSETRQELSIPAQKRELFEFIKRGQLSIVGQPIEEAWSAKRPGRPKFNEMIADLKRGRANAILIWHMDRLARNSEDGGKIAQMLYDGIIREIRTPREVYNEESDPLILAIAFGVATKYIHDLKRVVRRGQDEALEMGRWPHRTKLGYVRTCPCPPGQHSERHRKLPQVRCPERFELVKRIWRNTLDLVPVAETTRMARDEWNLRTPKTGKYGGRPLSIGQVYRLLHDPFYAGVMRYRGKTRTGDHEPMVTWGEFERVQAILSARSQQPGRPSRHVFTFGAGLIGCGRCGARVTAQFTTNRHGTRYIHYHCCRKRKRLSYCPEGSIEERALAQQLRREVERLIIPENALAAIEKLLPKLEHADQQDHAASVTLIKGLLAKTERKLQRLRELCVDERITADEFAADRERLLTEQRRLEEQLGTASDDRRLKPLKDGVSLLRRALYLLDHGTTAQKREVARKLFSNLVMNDKNLAASVFG